MRAGLKVLTFVLAAICALNFTARAWPEPSAATAPSVATAPSAAPITESPWIEYDLDEAGRIKIPESPARNLMVHNGPYTPWPHFFKGHPCEMKILLQALYQPDAAPHEAGLIVAVVRITATEDQKPDEDFRIKSTLEDSMAAFEENFVMRMAMRADSFDLVDKQIVQIADRPTFKASYRYTKGEQTGLIQAGVFLHEGRLYVVLVDAVQQAQTFWSTAFEQILAGWAL